MVACFLGIGADNIWVIFFPPSSIDHEGEESRGMVQFEMFDLLDHGLCEDGG